MHPSVKLPWCQQAADALRGNLLSGAGDEGVGEVLGGSGGDRSDLD